MPIYEYECGKCGRFEKIQKFSDPLLDACPTCGGAVQKVLSAPAFQFKGTGWYVTDYARSGKSDTKETKKTPESAKAEPAKTEAAPSSTSSDTKTAD